jgi:hypothetical protein
MSALEVRKFQGNFSGVDSLWNPDHPSFAIAMNKFSFWAIGFEKYTCDVMRGAARELATDDDLAKGKRQCHALQLVSCTKPGRQSFCTSQRANSCDS